MSNIGNSNSIFGRQSTAVAVDISPNTFNKSEDKKTCNIPMASFGETQYINGVKSEKIETSVGNSRYKIPEGTKISGNSAKTSYDSVANSAAVLATLDIPAGAISNFESIDVTIKYSTNQTFGTNGNFGVYFGSSSNTANRASSSISGQTVLTSVFRLTANDVNQIVLNGINAGVVGSLSSIGFSLTNGNSTRNINTLSSFTISAVHTYTTASNNGANVTAEISCVVNTSSPSESPSRSYVNVKSQPFGKQSFFNIPLANDVILQSDTDLETATFRNKTSQIYWGGTSVNIYEATLDDPIQEWNYASRANPNWYWPFTDTSGANGTVKFRTPLNITPAPSGQDNNLAIISPDGRYYVEAWKYVAPENDPLGLGRHTCRSFSVHDLYGNGWPKIYEDTTIGSLGVNSGVRAAGGPLLAGIVRAAEIEAGKIDHALVMILSLGKQKKVAPFSVSQNASSLPVVNTAGSGYKMGEVISVVGGTGRAAEMTITSLGANGSVTGIWPTNTGNYTVSPGTTNLATTGGSGTGCTIDCTILSNDRQSSRVFPATNVDGVFSSYAGDIPMGALFTIPKSVDVTTLGLSSPESVTFARAIQQYGIYNMDSAPNPTNAIFICESAMTTEMQNKITGRSNGVMTNLNKIAAVMVMVKNNAPACIGGYGPRAVNQSDGPYPLF